MKTKILQLGVFSMLAATIIFLAMSLVNPPYVIKGEKPVESVPPYQEELEVLEVPRTCPTANCSPQSHSHSNTTAEVTAYSEKDSCHYPGCVMSSGRRAYIGAAACPRHIPLQTKISIEGLGEFNCEDRTAAYLDGRFDVFMGYGEQAYQNALSFGKKLLNVSIE